jgi:hypothetical protein
MTASRISFEQWRSEAPAARAKIAGLLAALGNGARQQPRDSQEAEFLRDIGTPERLIGPPRES